MSDTRSHHVTVRLARKYEFIAEFNDVAGTPAMLLDEPEPLGDNRAPNAAAVLGAAVGDCLAASLAFCLRRSHTSIDGMTANVITHVARNQQGRFRISGIDVELVPEVAGADQTRLDRCESLFEDFCVVTESVRQGIPVNVSVKHREVTAA
jgi:organic hydroperoxide reductase OsmC/OhrA